MDVKLTDTEEAFELPAWRELLSSDPHRHIFSTPEWNRVWWEEFGAGKQLLVLTFLDPGPVGLAAFMLDRTEEGGRLRFCSDDENLTDYLGPLTASPQHLPGIAETLLRYLRDEADGWTSFEANCLPVPFGFAEHLVEAADRLGFDFTVDELEMTAVLALPSSFEGYMGRLSGKQRHELRRKLRRFDEAAPGAILRTSVPGTLEADLVSFVDLHRGSEGLKGKFMVPERAGFFARLARAFQPLGLLSLDFLEVEDRPVASMFSCRFEQTFSVYNSAYDQAWRHLSPGLVLATRLIERAIVLGLRRFDFLRGRERYKFDLGAEPLPLHAVHLRR
ncbi:MAG: GNAT family N-acetyltransferase [Actinomycetota bacterium]